MSGLTFLCWITSSSAFSFMPGRGRDATNTGRAPQVCKPVFAAVSSMSCLFSVPHLSYFFHGAISNAGLRVPQLLSHWGPCGNADPDSAGPGWGLWFSVFRTGPGWCSHSVLHYTLRQPYFAHAAAPPSPQWTLGTGKISSVVLFLYYLWLCVVVAWTFLWAGAALCCSVQASVASLFAAERKL